jgi:hypothetical protein
MPSPIRLAALAALLLPLAAAAVHDDAAAAVPDRDARRCSRGQLPPLPPVMPEVTLLVAVPLPDTVLAGAGGVRYTLRAGHAGRPDGDRPVHGQRFRVDDVRGAASTELERIFATTGSRDVVLVPWDYDAACFASLWGSSFRWLEGDDEVFLALALRPRAQWAAGRPTFDVHAAGLAPYGHARYAKLHGRAAIGRDDMLTPGELLELLTSFPLALWERGRTTREGVLARWRDAHPALARKYPANLLASDIGIEPASPNWRPLGPPSSRQPMRSTLAPPR